jgi:serine protease Do
VLIYKVESGSPAARAGIKGFDVLLELNGKKLNERLDFLTVMAQAKPGTKLKMTYWSQGQTYDREVLLTEAEEI